MGVDGPPKTMWIGGNHHVSIRMVDAKDGWAEINGPDGFRVLRTSDGAETWKDVMPAELRRKSGTCDFSTARNAFISIYSTNANAKGLWLTTNAGVSWTQTTNGADWPSEGLNVRFFGKTFAVGCVEEAGLGNSYSTFYQTHDSGMTWTPVDVKPRRPEHVEGMQSGMFHLCNLCGDKVDCYPPGTFVIAYGESEEPVKFLRLAVTRDAGQNWTDLTIPLHDGFTDLQLSPSSPVFFSAKNILLPVRTFRENNNVRIFSAVIFYRSTDGGKTWTFLPPLQAFDNGQGECNVVSPQNIFVRDGWTLHVSHDGAKTWETRDLKDLKGIDLSENNKREVAQMNFVDAHHGWMVVETPSTSENGYGDCFIFTTANGGKTWQERPIRIAR